MEFREFLTKAAEHWLEHNDQRSLGVKVGLSDREIESFLDAASKRDDPLWHEIDALLKQLQLEYPFRVPKLRKEIKWLRKQAKKKGLRWGT